MRELWYCAVGAVCLCYFVIVSVIPRSESMSWNKWGVVVPHEAPAIKMTYTMITLSSFPHAVYHMTRAQCRNILAETYQLLQIFTTVLIKYVCLPMMVLITCASVCISIVLPHKTLSTTMVHDKLHWWWWRWLLAYMIEQQLSTFSKRSAIAIFRMGHFRYTGLPPTPPRTLDTPNYTSPETSSHRYYQFSFYFCSFFFIFLSLFFHKTMFVYHLIVLLY